MAYAFKIIGNYYDPVDYSFTSDYKEFKNAFLSNLENENKTFLEVLNRHNREYKFYMDIDGIPYNNTETENKILIDFLKDVINNFFKFVDKYYFNNLNIDEQLKINLLSYTNKTLVTCNQNSNTHKGIGFHLIFPFSFKLNTGIYKMKDLMTLFVHQLKEILKDKQYKDYVDYIDCSVYTKNRLFRTIYNYQPGMIKNNKIMERDLKSYHYPVKFNDSGFAEDRMVDMTRYLIQNLDNTVNNTPLKLSEIYNKLYDDFKKIPKLDKPKHISQNNYKKEDIEKIEEKQKDIKINRIEIKDIPVNFYEQQNQQFKYLLFLITIINVVCTIYNIYFK